MLLMVNTAEKLQKMQLKREKEIAKWEREKARPKRNMYFVYLVFIIALFAVRDKQGTNRTRFSCIFNTFLALSVLHVVLFVEFECVTLTIHPTLEGLQLVLVLGGIAYIVALHE